jgi:hypothetical protein
MLSQSEAVGRRWTGIGSVAELAGGIMMEGAIGGRDGIFPMMPIRERFPCPVCHAIPGYVLGKLAI